MVARKEGKIDMPNYEVIVSVKNEKYFCRFPELNLIAKGNDLESSYQELMKKKEELIKEVVEFQGDDELVPPSTTWSREGGRQWGSSVAGNGLMGFLVRAGISGLMALVILYITTQTIGEEIRDVVDSSVTKSSSQLESTLNSTLSTVDKSIMKMVTNIRTEIEDSIPTHPGRNIESELYRAVDHPIDPEREEKIVNSIRVIVNRLKPFAKELRPLLEEFGLAGKKD